MIRAEDQIREVSYPGRIIVAGVLESGTPFVLYAITARSAKSRNRVIKRVDGKLVTLSCGEEYDELLHYTALKETRQGLLIANGDHSLEIAKALDLGMTMEEAYSSLLPEPDEPNATPRIAVLERSDCHIFSIVYRDSDGSVVRRSRSYPLKRGVAHTIRTYEGNGDPLPPFKAEAVEGSVEGDFISFANSFYSSLSPKLRVALYCRAGEEELIINEKEIVSET